MSRPVPFVGVAWTALVLLGAFVSRAQAWCQMTAQNVRMPANCAAQCNRDVTATKLAWRRRCSAISFSNWGPSSDLNASDVRAIFQRSINTWTSVTCAGQSPGLDVTLLPTSQNNACEFPSYFQDSPNVNSVIFVANGWTTQREHEPMAFALTLVWHDANTGEILDVDMEINEARGNYAICPATGCPPNSGTIDLENVITHEMGHYFGLAHSDVNASTMFCSAETTEVIKRDLDADDIAGLCAVYPQGSLPETCNRTPINGLGLSCRPRSCGCRVLGAHAPLPLAWTLSALALFLSFSAILRRRRS